MSLQFIYGPAGSGKSHKLNHELITQAIAHPDKRYLLIVPDQFTMHSQLELVRSHPRRGILNIEVLSFGRLSHRIFEEVGQSPLLALDDLGKSLVLRKVAADIAKKLPIIGSSMQKSGFVAELKSTISEFMQYGIDPAELGKMVEFSANRGALSAKLRDIQCLYAAFLDYINDKYVTAEETLGLLCAALPHSRIVRDSVIAFDGFTGFTPLQNRVILETMKVAGRVIVTVLQGTESVAVAGSEAPALKEHSLFYLTQKMVADLSRLAVDAGIEREADVVIEEKIPRRFMAGSDAGVNYELAHLEKHLFRYPLQVYAGDDSPASPGATAASTNSTTSNTPATPTALTDPVGQSHPTASPTASPAASPTAIHIHEAPSVAAEVRRCFIEIKKLCMDAGHAYRDIAIITGDMNSYEPYLSREAAKYGVPIYLDRTQKIALNPFTEFIRQALRIIIKNYSYESVFHFARSGFLDISNAEIDRLENYCIACGIRGRSQWTSPFVRPMATWRGREQSEALSKLNHTRGQLLTALAPLGKKMKTAGEMVEALYDFVMAGNVQNKLKLYEDAFAKRGDMVRAKEYAQIFRLVMQLLEQIHALLQDEPMSLKDFAQILEAGFSELRVGTIPQSVDRVVVGDIERTRLGSLRALFFLGVNDGNIPAGAGGGLLSDLDREFLATSPWELAPTPRQRMYTQRLYLYINMTRPSERLYVSYALVGGDSKSLRPSYLIDMLKRMFPPSARDARSQPASARIGTDYEADTEQLFGLADSLDVFVENLRLYAAAVEGVAAGTEATLDRPSLLTILVNVYHSDARYRPVLHRLMNQAFSHYSHRPLTRSVADLLYGELLNESASRLEQFASCAYAHFLKYALLLREREAFSFEAVDLGNVYHGVLELYATKLAEGGHSWQNFDDETARCLLDEALSEYVALHRVDVLYGSARHEQMIGRIRRIMLRTVRALREQLKQGDFYPRWFEAAFAQEYPDSLVLRGKIDRIDMCIEDDAAYVKVVDYKSGFRRFDLASAYYGLQLQLITYLKMALDMAAKAHPDKAVSAAAVLYYHIFDPIVSEEGELSAADLELKLLSELRMTGMVNKDAAVIEKLDKHFAGKSWVIPVELKKDGDFSARSAVMSGADFQVAMRFVEQKIRDMATQIKAGDIDLNPYKKGGDFACKYCQYKHVCGFDLRLPGHGLRQLTALSPAEVLEKMKADINPL